MNYLRPQTLDDVLDIISDGKRRIAAGCTDLFTLTDQPDLPWPVCDITGVKLLRGIVRSENGWRIGAATTWNDIVEADLPSAFDGLKLAAREVGSRQIQNSGTIGGNICNASPAADGVPPLLTMDASVEIASRSGKRTLALEDFILAPRKTALQEDEILTAILIPADLENHQSHFIKLGARKHLVISITMVAVRLEVEGNRISCAAIAVGSCSPVARRLPQLERMLIGCEIDRVPEMATDKIVNEELSPIDDVRADQAYRYEAAGEIVRRGLLDITDRVWA